MNARENAGVMHHAGIGSAVRRWAASLLLLSALPGCGGGGGAAGVAGSSGASTSSGITHGTTLALGDDAPGVVVNITSITGGGSSGSYPTVTFTIRDTSGDNWFLSEMAAGSILISGPSTNYQRVIAEQTDLITRSVYQGNGTYTYTFPTPMPVNYLAPYNDSATYGSGDGELQGTALQAGTYTVGIFTYWNYTADGVAYKDVANDTEDFLFGAGVLSAREVVKNDNCNYCHVTLQAHSGVRRETKLCLLCHTSGAEDWSATYPAAGGTPGTTIDFRVMIHKIHSGAKLASVLGISTDGTGARTYGNTATTDCIVDSAGTLHNYSAIISPVFPSYSAAVAKKVGYEDLSSTNKTTDGSKRQGLIACYKCHGDPDGAGALTAPSQGNLITTQPTRRACGSCHDDVVWANPYAANSLTMAAQANDGSCTTCHAASGTPGAGNPTSTSEAHVHPAVDPTYYSGLNFAITAVTGWAAGTHFVAGEKPVITFTVKDDANVNVPFYKLSANSTTAVGPNTNRQLVFPMNGPKSATVPVADFSGRLVFSSSTSGRGTMSRVVGSTASEVLKVQFTSATAFTVTATSNLSATTDLSARGTGALQATQNTATSGISISNIELDPTFTSQLMTVTFASATSFTIAGSVSGASVVGTLPGTTGANAVGRYTFTDGGGATCKFTITTGTVAPAGGAILYMCVFKTSSNNHLFAITSGTNGAFASGHRFYYETVDNSLTSYTYNLPMDMLYEFLGDATGTTGTFVAGNLPVYAGRQTVYERTASTDIGATITVAAANDRFVAVSDWSGLSGGKICVIDDGTANKEEYLLVGTTDLAPDGATQRVWFTTPLRYSHVGATTIKTVAFTTRLEATHYTLNPTTGTVYFINSLTSGNAVVMSYRTHGAFGRYRHNGDARQDTYPPPMNDAANLGQDWGEWQGLAFQSGTYNLSVWGTLPIYVTKNGSTQVYSIAETAATSDVRYGSSGTATAYGLISSANNCAKCHDGIYFHGGSREGADTCLTCHGTAGCEDWPQYASAGTVITATSGVTVNFRTMLHKIHMGEELTNASTYTVVGNSAATHTYEEVVFPPMPGHAKHCTKCHGDANTAWKTPSTRTHAAETAPTRNWNAVCTSCHDSTTTQTHVNANTVAGVEACGTCHGVGQTYAVETVHKNR